MIHALKYLNISWSKNISTHIPIGYSINVVNKYDDNYHTYYRGIDCINKLSNGLLEIGKQITNKEKNAMIPLNCDQEIKHNESTHCYLCNQSFNTNKQIKYYKNYKKVKDHCYYTGIYRGAAHYLCNLRYQEQQDITVIIHNGSNYDFHLLIRDLAEEFKSDMYCLGENTEKYISFSVKIDTKKSDNEKIDYNLQFIDSYCYMSSSLDSLVDNLSEINNKTCISCKEKNKTTQYCEYIKLNKNRLMYKCLYCNDISYKPLKPLINNFSNTYRLSNNNDEKFILLLRKGVYPYEYMDNWDKFNET